MSLRAKSAQQRLTPYARMTEAPARIGALVPEALGKFSASGNGLTASNLARVTLPIGFR